MKTIADLDTLSIDVAAKTQIAALLQSLFDQVDYNNTSDSLRGDSAIVT